MARPRSACAAWLAGLAVVMPFATLPALALDPDDTPWSLNEDTKPSTAPGSIEELLERDRQNIIEDHDIAPPGQDQPDYVAKPGSGELDEDRLAPKLPAEIHDAKDATPQTTVRAVEPPVDAAAQTSTPQTATLPADPSPGPLPHALRARDVPAALTPAQAPQTPARAVPDTRTAMKAAPSVTGPIAPAATSNPPPVQSTQIPAAVPPNPAPPTVPTPSPAQATIATEQDPSAPPPLAVPSEPVAQAGIAVNGKLYLPIKRYFESTGVSILATYDMGDRSALAAHYQRSVGEALWVTKSGFNDAARALIGELSKADDWGLASIDYKVPSLPEGGEIEYERLTDGEEKLSLAVLEYARHARGDRIDDPTTQLSSYIDRKPQLIEAPKVIEALIVASDKAAYLRSLHPKHAQFEMLREKLLDLRQQQSAERDIERVPDGPKINPGKSHSTIAVLRRRFGTPLTAGAANASQTDENFYDEELARAVIDYKRKHQIEPVNATITNDLRRSLNQKPSLDEDAILANMEQWRWMPEDLGETHVWVNVPEFLVRVKKADAVIHEERVVTGRYETQTPIFSNRLRTVVFQPSWNVPESIKVNELLPKLRAGGNPVAGQGLKMERNGREVDAWNVDWSRQDIRNYHIFQPPGASNVLGVVKFLFPNKHAVYLHDTPTKKLFNEKIRTFSHGCMRVRNPVRLAEVIMAEDKGWDTEKVRALVDDGPADNDVALDKPMPVHVTYFTLWVDETGDVQRFADIYGHEKRIKLGLHGRWEDIDKHKDHLEPADPRNIIAREDWGDQDDDQPARRKRARTRYSYDERSTIERPAPATNRQASQKKPKSSAFSDFMNNIFGAN